MTHVRTVFTLERDPDDAHYVDLAVAADACLIISRDRDFLDLMDELRADSLAFWQSFPALRIIDPVQLIREVTPKA